MTRSTRKSAESGDAKGKAKAEAGANQQETENPTKAEAAPDADQKPEPHEAEQTQADQAKASGPRDTSGSDEVAKQREEAAKAQGFAPPDGEGADPESANAAAERPDSYPTGAREDAGEGASQAAHVDGDEESDRSTLGGERRATAASGNRFDGVVTAGASNMETDDEEPVSDARLGTGQPQGNVYGEEGVGARSMTGYVEPGGSNAEFNDDVEAEKGTPAKQGGKTDSPASGPLDAPSGYSNEAGEETFGREKYQDAAGPRPDEDEYEDDTKIVGKDGSSLGGDSLFTDADGKTFVFAKQRIYEEYTYPNTTETARRLLYAEGARVSLAEAEAVKARA